MKGCIPELALCVSSFRNERPATARLLIFRDMTGYVTLTLLETKTAAEEEAAVISWIQWEIYGRIQD